MKLRNLTMKESIEKQFSHALENDHTVLNPTEANALEVEKAKKEEAKEDFKEVDKVADEVAKATNATETTTKVKDRKELSKLLSEAKEVGKKWKISRCLDEGYRYLVEWIEEIEMERDGEEDNTYLVIEGAREGYGIDQVEGDTLTVGQLKDVLDNFDDSIKVVIGNDFRAGSYYTYGAVNEGNMKEVTITESEEDDWDDDEEETADESLHEAKEDKKEPETFDEKMDFLAADEQEAIDGYEKIIASLGEEDAHVKEQLDKILIEEKAHKKFLEDVKADHSILYTEPLDEPKEDKDLEEKVLTEATKFKAR